MGIILKKIFFHCIFISILLGDIMFIIEKERLKNRLSVLDESINSLNDQKILALLESIGILERKDIAKDFLKWNTILIAVPNRKVSQ